jgi:hypothetical protein
LATGTFRLPTLDELVAAGRDSDDTVVAGRRIGEFSPMGEHPQHSHRIEDIIGYAVRVTVLDGAVLHGGYTVETFDGGSLFPRAQALALEYRERWNAWAVIDRLYTCGCRTDI